MIRFKDERWDWTITLAPRIADLEITIRVRAANVTEALELGRAEFLKTIGVEVDATNVEVVRILKESGPLYDEGS